MKKRFLGMLFGISLGIIGMTAGAQESDLTPGVTVYEDAESATGYSATFVFESAEAQEVVLRGSFKFFTDDLETRTYVPEQWYSPYEWEPGMFVSGDEAYTEAMTRIEGTDYWTLTLPLPSGQYEYVFLVDDGDKIDDPANPSESSEDCVNGHTCGRSVFYVPYDEKKQAGSTDYSFRAPRTDGQAGTVSYVNYVGMTGEDEVLGVYLPYGYDAEREEPYKVVYFSHGGGGNETDWFSIGSADTIFDNLIADGVVEPTILVTMNNTVYTSEEDASLWKFDTIGENLAEKIIPYMEEHYNVSKEASGRAYVGMSRGGSTGTNIYYSYADIIGYFGLFSGADGTLDFTALDKSYLQQAKLMLGGGVYDEGVDALTPDAHKVEYKTMLLRDTLNQMCVPYTFAMVEGAHDWFTWPQLLKIFIETTLWK